MSESDGPQVGPIELRVIPRMRVARVVVRCLPDALWPAVEAAKAAVTVRSRVAVAGVPIVVFPGLAHEEHVTAEIRVPVSDVAPPIPASDVLPEVTFTRIDRHRAACRTFSGRPGSALARAVDGLFSWVDANKLGRNGGEHHHVYTPNSEPRAITMEIRVPVQ